MCSYIPNIRNMTLSHGWLVVSLSSPPAQHTANIEPSEVVSPLACSYCGWGSVKALPFAAFWPSQCQGCLTGLHSHDVPIAKEVQRRALQYGVSIQLKVQAWDVFKQGETLAYLQHRLGS